MSSIVGRRGTAAPGYKIGPTLLDRSVELLRYLPPNATALVRICGNVFAARWIEGRLVIRKLDRHR